MNKIMHVRRELMVLAGLGASLVGGSAVSAQITMATVPVGNPGNTADTAVAIDRTKGYGSVNYTYNIGQYDVTASQYTVFLNAVATTDTYALYNSFMSGTTGGRPGITQSGSPGSYTYSVDAGRANNPVTAVTFFDAARFVNWLENGQPTGPEGTGTTETGTYSLSGINKTGVTRNAGATWALPSEDEWYKAAYYSPTLNGGAGGYWLFPTQSNTFPPAQGNTIDNDLLVSTPVGSYPYPSYYGTYDQGGNVWQWDEAIIDTGFRGVRGGSFAQPSIDVQSVYRSTNASPSQIAVNFGFRVVELPEPASLGILAVGFAGTLLRRRGVRR